MPYISEEQVLDAIDRITRTIDGSAVDPDKHVLMPVLKVLRSSLRERDEDQARMEKLRMMHTRKPFMRSHLVIDASGEVPMIVKNNRGFAGVPIEFVDGIPPVGETIEVGSGCVQYLIWMKYQDFVFALEWNEHTLDTFSYIAETMAEYPALGAEVWQNEL